jgi:L-ascorbate metabolism protein UlaG (beta-lactamase superfamily)
MRQVLLVTEGHDAALKKACGMKTILISIFIVIAISGCVQNGDGVDEIRLNDGTTVRWLGHASFQIYDKGTMIYIDPYVLPKNAEKADYILITHDHFDHCAPDRVSQIQKSETRIVTVHSCIKKGLSGKTNTITPEEFFEYPNLKVEAIPAYNINKQYHPEGSGIGFVITFNSRKFYHAGDTDNIPEMSNLTDIYMAFLPIGGTYTMNVEEAAEAAKTINPKIVVPMHYNSEKYGVKGINADPQKLKKLLEGTNIQVTAMNPSA